jgi:hypothetical protein
MESILAHHDAVLRSLDVRLQGNKHFLSEEISKIGAHWSFLEDLNLTIRRSKGDASEVSIYQALGSF